MDDIVRVDVYVRNMEHFDRSTKSREYFKARRRFDHVDSMTSPIYRINAPSCRADDHASALRGRGDVIVVTGGATASAGLVRAAAAGRASSSATSTRRRWRLSRAGSARLDVSDRAQCSPREVERDFGRIDGLVCAAAIQPQVARARDGIRRNGIG